MQPPIQLRRSIIQQISPAVLVTWWQNMYQRSAFESYEPGYSSIAHMLSVMSSVMDAFSVAIIGISSSTTSHRLLAPDADPRRVAVHVGSTHRRRARGHVRVARRVRNGVWELQS
jgi:hypothetical protein